MKVKWMLLIILLVWGFLLFTPAHKIDVNKDPGAMYVSSPVYCAPVNPGVQLCSDGKRSWYVYTKTAMMG